MKKYAVRKDCLDGKCNTLETQTLEDVAWLIQTVREQQAMIEKLKKALARISNFTYTLDNSPSAEADLARKALEYGKE